MIYVKFTHYNNRKPLYKFLISTLAICLIFSFLLLIIYRLYFDKSKPAKIEQTMVVSPPVSKPNKPTTVLIKPIPPDTTKPTVKANNEIKPHNPVKPQPAKPKAKDPVIIHIVQKHETLFSISRKYGVTIESIKADNKLNNHKILAGSSLIIKNAKKHPKSK